MQFEKFNGEDEIKHL